MPSPEDIAHTPFCFCTPVADQALTALQESGGVARLRDDHPWFVAQTLVQRAHSTGLAVPLLLVTESDMALKQWSRISAMEIIELSGKRYDTRITLGPLQPITPLFERLDSLYLKPPDEQLERERREGVRSHRFELTPGLVRPYAICESPGFIPGLSDWSART